MEQDLPQPQKQLPPILALEPTEIAPRLEKDFWRTSEGASFDRSGLGILASRQAEQVVAEASASSMAASGDPSRAVNQVRQGLVL